MRSALTISLAGFLAFASGAGIAAAGDKQKCTIATAGDSEPAKACARGGRSEARKVMKKMVNDAKAKGQKIGCESCHMNLDDYELLKTAREDLTKLEAALAKK